MSTFLELCQAVARESGTVSSTNFETPATVVGQTGRLLRVVHWTRDAYRQIQAARDDWTWLRHDFTGQTISGVQRYKINTVERFRHWIHRGDRGSPVFTIYKTADGQANEGFLTYYPWEEFRYEFLIGSAATETGQPRAISVDPQQQLVLYPIPDAAYTLRGEYYKSPQILTADADVPEMPSAHHEAIQWRGLILMGTFDEAVEQVPAWGQFYAEHLAALERKFTPRILLGGPLA